MEKLRDLLKSSTFSKPNLTREEWDEIERAADAAEKAEYQRQYLSRTQTIPRAFKNADLAKVDRRIATWAEAPTVGLLIQGDVGRGKTYAACAALLHLAKSTNVRFTTPTDMFQDIRDIYKSRIDISEKDATRRYIASPVLCIDDLGKEKATEWSNSLLFHIILNRHANLHPTIITTNCTGHELLRQLTVDGDSKYARAMLSRFKDFDRVVLDGEDRRGKCMTA